MNPAKAIKDILSDQGVGTFAATSGWSIQVGRMPASQNVPDSVIAVVHSGGEEGNPKWLLDYPHIQVMVRGQPNGYLDAWDKTKQVYDTLLGIYGMDVDGGRIDGITAIGFINSLGFDDSDRPTFTVNFRLIAEPDPTPESNRMAL